MAKAARASASATSATNGALRRRYPTPQDSPRTTELAKTTSSLAPLAPASCANRPRGMDTKASTRNNQRVASRISPGRRTRIRTRADNPDSRLPPTPAPLVDADASRPGAGEKPTTAGSFVDGGYRSSDPRLAAPEASRVWNLDKVV